VQYTVWYVLIFVKPLTSHFTLNFFTFKQNIKVIV